MAKRGRPKGTKNKSKGLGDTVEKITKATGIDKVVKITTKALGIEDCGCDARKEALNKLVTYKNTSPNPSPMGTKVNIGDRFLFLSNVTNVIDGNVNRIEKGSIIIASEQNIPEIEGYLIAELLRKID